MRAISSRWPPRKGVVDWRHRAQRSTSTERTAEGPATPPPEAAPRDATARTMMVHKAIFQGVALVWERHGAAPHSVRISLEAALPPGRDGATAAPAAESASDRIPPSVLQFERHLRKVQHFKKAGARLEESQLRTLFVDDALVVVDKPAGVLSVPGVNANASIGDLVHRRYGREVDGVANMIVHRLDMDTSGILVFARQAETTRRLHTIFRDRDVTKEYVALVQGHLPDWMESGIIDLPLQRDHEHPPFMRVATPTSELGAAAAVAELKSRGWTNLVKRKPKPSQTEFSVTERGHKDGLPFTRVRLTPVTGRTHQLRVHLAALGFPILGDPVYSLFGEGNPKGGLSDVESIVRGFDDAVAQPCPLEIQQQWTKAHPPNDVAMCLHAARLEFEHPITNERLVFQANPGF